MDSDIQQELTSLIGELTELTAVFARGQAAAEVEIEGTDPQGAVSVRLDPAGRVAAFRPHAQWRSRVSADELGTAIVQAVQAATLTRMERWAEAIGDETAAPPAPPSLPRVAPSTDMAVDLPALTEEVLSRFEALDTAPGGAAAGTDGDDTAQVVAGTARVRVALAFGGIPTAMAIDPGWLGTANLTRLAEEVQAAFTAAYAELDAAGAQVVAGPQMSAAMAAVARDPAGMLLRYAQTLGVDVSPDAPTDPARSADPRRR